MFSLIPNQINGKFYKGKFSDFFLTTNLIHGSFFRLSCTRLIIPEWTKYDPDKNPISTAGPFELKAWSKIQDFSILYKKNPTFKDILLLQDPAVLIYALEAIINRYRRKSSKVNASIFHSALERVGKKEKKKACPLFEVFACGQVSSPRRYR